MELFAPTILPFWGNDGTFLSGGKLFVYAGGTTNKQDAFTDASGGTALPNPVILNTRGEVAPSSSGTMCGAWFDPTLEYKLVLAPATDTDPPTNAFWTIDNIVSPQAAILASLAAFEATLAGVQIGSMLPYGGTTAPTGWLLCFGQAVSRTTYSALFARIGTNFGVGDGSTTFNLPDLRGRYPLGKDDMGGSAANRVTAGVSGITATTLGAVGGDQHAQADTINASSTASSALTDPGHRHQQYYTGSFPGSGVQEGGVANAVGPGSRSPDMQTDTAFTNIAVTTTVTTTATSTLTGASQNIPPCQVLNWIVFTGVNS